MDSELKDLLRQIDHWPPAAQRELHRAAMEIAKRLVPDEAAVRQVAEKTLLDVMQACPISELDFERRSNHPEFRDVTL